MVKGRDKNTNIINPDEGQFCEQSEDINKSNFPTSPEMAHERENRAQAQQQCRGNSQYLYCASRNLRLLFIFAETLRNKRNV